jgi:hypothetical protein
MKPPINDGLMILIQAIEYMEYIDRLNANAQRLAENRAKEFALTVLDFHCPGTR